MSERLWQQVNWRVVVWPDHYPFSEAEDERICKTMVGNIRRHVDDVDTVEIKSDCVCRACGNPREEPPLCCEAAIQGWEREHPEWSCDDEGNWIKAVGDHA